MSKEGREKIGSLRRGKTGSLRRGKTGNLKGMKWFNNGIKNVRALKCPEGFKPGNIQKHINQYPEKYGNT
jgi:hypothetical protein